MKRDCHADEMWLSRRWNVKLSRKWNVSVTQMKRDMSRRWHVTSHPTNIITVTYLDSCRPVYEIEIDVVQFQSGQTLVEAGSDTLWRSSEHVRQLIMETTYNNGSNQLNWWLPHNKQQLKSQLIWSPHNIQRLKSAQLIDHLKIYTGSNRLDRLKTCHNSQKMSDISVPWLTAPKRSASEVRDERFNPAEGRGILFWCDDYFHATSARPINYKDIQTSS